MLCGLILWIDALLQPGAMTAVPHRPLAFQSSVCAWRKNSEANWGCSEGDSRATQEEKIKTVNLLFSFKAFRAVKSMLQLENLKVKRRK